MPEDNALLNHLHEIDSFHAEIQSALDAGTNTLELEVNEDSKELHEGWSQMRSGLGRARAAVAALRESRLSGAPAVEAVTTRNPIDDEG